MEVEIISPLVILVVEKFCIVVHYVRFYDKPRSTYSCEQHAVIDGWKSFFFF